MRIAMVVFSSLLTLAAFASASVKMRKSPQVVEGMTHVGVRPQHIPLLALLEIAGGVGLLVGFASATLGRLAAVGLAVYFLGAVAAHLRIRDDVKTWAPAASLLVISAITVLLQVQR